MPATSLIQLADDIVARVAARARSTGKHLALTTLRAATTAMGHLAPSSHSTILGASLAQQEQQLGDRIRSGGITPVALEQAYRVLALRHFENADPIRGAAYFLAAGDFDEVTRRLEPHIQDLLIKAAATNEGASVLRYSEAIGLSLAIGRLDLITESHWGNFLVGTRDADRSRPAASEAMRIWVGQFRGARNLAALDYQATDLAARALEYLAGRETAAHSSAIRVSIASALFQQALAPLHAVATLGDAVNAGPLVDHALTQATHWMSQMERAGRKITVPYSGAVPIFTERMDHQAFYEVARRIATQRDENVEAILDAARSIGIEHPYFRDFDTSEITRWMEADPALQLRRFTPHDRLDRKGK